MFEKPNSQLTFAGFSEETPSPHWTPLIESLDALGPEETCARMATARRALREQGIACHVPPTPGAPPLGIDRPWELDILPLVISAEEWRGLEAGLTQRARLLNRLLNDLHGSQHTLRDGWLPAPLIYANPAYLRPCQAIRVLNGNYLPFYAVDLARSADGQWQVLADRTQNPSGLGFMLENRALVSRVLPEALQALKPRSLAGALPLLRQTLNQFFPAGHGESTVAVLTPGPHNEAYFEHTFLARKLCCPLAEGADLTVRNRQVYLKTLEELRPVDVILRRVNDAYCDPLEFRGDSLLGVPGLLDAVRAGNVAVANALGCGLVESPAFLAFLPILCQRLLGEDLLLPSLATWWCGGGKELREVRSRLDCLAIRPAWLLANTPSRNTGMAENSALEARLVNAPYQYIGQEEVTLSRIPALRPEGTRCTEPFYLRLFLIGDGNTYHLLPGGLARLPGHDKLTSALFPLPQRSKDVWVLPDETTFRQPETGPATELRSERTPIDLPSRVADNLFWLGRYAERLEIQARIARNVFACDLGTENAPRREALQGLCWRMGLHSQGELPPSLLHGIRDLLQHIHLAAFAVRDRLSADTWRLLNRMPSRIPPTPAASTDAQEALDALILDLAAFSGMEMENMTRNHGWLFLDFGRRQERAGNLLSLILGVIDAPSNAELLFEPMLEICDSVITFRQRYFAAIRLADALELLLLQRDNPRSLAFQLQALEAAAASLPGKNNRPGTIRLCQLITDLAASVRSLRIEEKSPAPPLEDKPLRNTLLAFIGQLRAISDLLTQTYFIHSIPRVN